MGCGQQLSFINIDEAWNVFDSSTASVMSMISVDVIDKEIANLLRGDLKDVVISAVDAAYEEKGYIFNE